MRKTLITLIALLGGAAAMAQGACLPTTCEHANFTFTVAWRAPGGEQNGITLESVDAIYDHRYTFPSMKDCNAFRDAVVPVRDQIALTAVPRGATFLGATISACLPGPAEFYPSA